MGEGTVLIFLYIQYVSCLFPNDTRILELSRKQRDKAPENYFMEIYISTMGTIASFLHFMI